MCMHCRRNYGKQYFELITFKVVKRNVENFNNCVKAQVRGIGFNNKGVS